MNDDDREALRSMRKEIGSLREQVAKLGDVEQMAVRIVEVERLDIGRDDVLFVHVPELADQAYVNSVAAAVHQVLGSHRVLVLAGGITVTAGELPADEAEAHPDEPTVCPDCAGSGKRVAGGNVLACQTCGGGGTLGRLDG